MSFPWEFSPVYRLLPSVELVKDRLRWVVAEDRRQAIDPLTDHRIRLMANLIADEELNRQKMAGVWLNI